MESVEDWTSRLEVLYGSREAMPFHLVGVGNPIKKDDSVGLVIISRLRKIFGSKPSKLVRIYSPLAPELLFSKISFKSGSLIIFDAVEHNRAPGSIIFANIADTRFGFFATHNVPLKLIPSLSGRMPNIFLVGIQPKDVDFGEGLSAVVLNSANKVVAEFETIIKGRLLNAEC